MSTKRGRRNGKWHKEKQIRRLQSLRDDLWQKSIEREYIPLEKPVFAGWDISIGVTESGARRRDSEDIQKILNILNLSRELFTKDVKFIRHIRNNGHFLDSVKSFYQYRGYTIDHFSNRHITYHEYHNLPEDLKKWFYADRYYKYSSWMNDKCYYGVKSEFPWYECKIVIERSFYNYKIVYDTQAQSEHDKLDADLWLWDRKSSGHGYHYDGWKKSEQKFKNGLKIITNKNYSPEEIDENYSIIFKNV